MKGFKYILICAACICLMTSCQNDWTIKDMPAVPEKADGAGYVTGFDTAEAKIVIPVEVKTADNYKITIRGRASLDGSVGTGVISCGGSSANFTFEEANVWQDCDVTLALEAGINYIEISAGAGNGLFHIDYIELR